MKYTAASLDDIAKQFDARAADAARCDRSMSHDEIMANYYLSLAYKSAANFLRNTTLTGEA